MLGRLLQSATSSFGQHGASRPQSSSLESVTEEAHTRDLLFPDIVALRTSQQSGLPFYAPRVAATAREAAGYDDRGGLDIANPGDIRILIAQDATAYYHQPQILFDSKPPKPSSSRHDAAKGETEPVSSHRARARGKSMTMPNRISSTQIHPARLSLFAGSQAVHSAPSSPRPPEAKTRGLFGGGRTGPSQFETPSHDHESVQGKIARETKEEMEALLSCMFGAPGFRLESGTKLHIIPRRSQNTSTYGSKSPSRTRPISSGGSFTRQRTPLVRSISAADLATSGNDGLDQCMVAGNKPCIMFTRLLTVQLPESASPDGVMSGSDNLQNVTQEDLAQPPKADQAGDPPTKQTIKQRKVPMYAIAVVIQLPADNAPGRLRGSGGSQGTVSLGSSYHDSIAASSWRSDQSTFSSFLEARANGLLCGDTSLNAHVSFVLKHWNIVGRSLMHLELVTKEKLCRLLEKSLPVVPLMATPPRRSGQGKLKRPKQSTQQSVFVPSECLQDDSEIVKHVSMIGQNITSGLKARRVVTGQGRWGEWREEARWVARWANSREQNFFFFSLLTAFLSCHTSWLERLAPKWYRRRRASQKIQEDGDRDGVRCRTVVITTDKMAARRLVFLLATFLPGITSLQLTRLPAAVPGTGVAYSESPPSVPMMQDRSLRGKTGNRPDSVHRTTVNSTGYARTVSFSLIDVENGNATGNGVAPSDRHERHRSSSKSIRASSAVLPQQQENTRKASSSTLLADSALPVPHFTGMSVGTTTEHIQGEKPGGGDSLASLALTRSLSRSETTNPSSNGSGGRWGSVVSGFWSSRPESSADESDSLASAKDAPTRSKATRGESVSHQPDRLTRMVEEAAHVPRNSKEISDAVLAHSPIKFIDIESCLKKRPPPRDGASSARNIPQGPGLESMPLKLSMNEQDGYIDISLPPNQSLNSSLASSYASVRFHHRATGEDSEHFSPYGRPSFVGSPPPRSEPNVDVCGWLKTYHPDFALQAVRPYSALRANIEASMHTEARLCALPARDDDDNNDKWTEVCTTLVANTSSFTVDRLSLRRRRIAARDSSSAETFEHEMITEPAMDMDAALTDAVENILAQSGLSSQTPSQGPSPPPSRPASIRYFKATMQTEAGMDGMTSLEVPNGECKKMIIGALRQVVKEVTEERSQLDPDGTGKRKRVQDSSLRAAVRKWLTDVEEGTPP